MKRIVLFLLLFGILFPIIAAAQSTTWTDPATKLMWTGQDNGSKVKWHQAKDYCANLRLGGYSNWRLASIDELAAIYDPKLKVGNYHIKGGIKLSDGWVWSGTTLNGISDMVWHFFFGDGERDASLVERSLDKYALCVCTSGK